MGDYQGGHPKQLINMFASEPGVDGWTSLPFKPHYWPGDNSGIFSGRGTSQSLVLYYTLA